MTTTVDNDVATISLTASQLRDALTWVTPSADTDPVSNLRVVHFSCAEAANAPKHYNNEWVKQEVAGSGSVLSMAATDRFRLTYASITLPEVAPEAEFMVEAKALTQVMRGWPKQKAEANQPVSIIIEDSDVTFEVTDRSGVTRRETLPKMTTWSFPKYVNLVPDIALDETVSGFTVEGKFIADLGTAASKIGRGFRLAAHDNLRAMAVATVWENDLTQHSGVLMPMRLPA